MTKDSSRVTPADMADRLGTTPMQVRRILRAFRGTLKKQSRGPRRYLTKGEVAHVTMVTRAWKLARKQIAFVRADPLRWLHDHAPDRRGRPGWREE